MSAATSTKRDVASEDQPLLYRCRSFLRHGIPLGGSTDAPYGLPDPWVAMRAAVHRRTAKGRRLGKDETLSPEEALALFTSPLEAPGAPPRRVRSRERLRTFACSPAGGRKRERGFLRVMLRPRFGTAIAFFPAELLRSRLDRLANEVRRLQQPLLQRELGVFHPAVERNVQRA